MSAIIKKNKYSSGSLLKEMWKHKSSYIFMLPYLSLFIIFTVLPVLISVVLSFTYFNVLQPPSFVFLKNYLQLFLDDSIFQIAVKNTITIAIIVGPVSYFLCLLLAWFINELTPKIRAFITLVFYAPSIAGNAYLIWGVMFSSDQYGYLNSMLIKLNIIVSPILWLKDPRYMLNIVILVSLWLSLGTSFLAFIAGFQGIDRSFYEAAAVDGIRNRWQELWYVTLPMMKPQMMFSAVMSITASFGVGDVVTNLCGFPSNDYAAHTIINHLQDYGGTRFEMGYASAIATILFLIMVISNLVIKRLISKVGE